MFKLRDYQEQGAVDCCNLLQKYKIAYLCWEVRTGKSLTALQAANLYGAKKVLFITKKRAIDTKTIENDYDMLNPTFAIQIINNESLHKITDNDFDLVISDEHHRNSAYPKPNKSCKIIKQRFGHLPMIFLSGTPAIESGSQWYHSFFVSNYSPFREYRNFYAWARTFTNKKMRYLGSIQVNDYSESIDRLINPIIEPYLLKYTQKEAGFTAEIQEHVLYCNMLPKTEDMINKLLKDKMLQGKDDVVLADTAVKLMSKIHQLSNGTVILESGNAIITDTTKAEFIRQYFRDKKIGIFYYFQKELELLKTVFKDTLTIDINEFNTTNKNIALQQVSGSEAISLKEADAIVYYSFGYSGKNYCQGRDRMTTKDRAENNVYFVFMQGDINEKIHMTVKTKKRYNEKLFRKDYKL